MKKKSIIVSLILIVLIFIYIQMLYPFLQEKEIKTYLKDKWNVNINSKDKLIIFNKNKRAWHGEQQKFTLFEATDDSKLHNYIDNKDTNKMDFNMTKRVMEIEDILNIEKSNRVDFNSNYYYKVYTNMKVTSASEQKNDLLYYISIKENNKLKIFFIEDLNVLDLERSKFN